MSKVNKLDPCMFCGETPCECNNKIASKPRPKKKSKPKEDVPAESAKVTGRSTQKSVPVDIKAAMKRRKDKSNSGVATSRERITVRQSETKVEAYDDDFSSALRALKPLLHRHELSKYRDILVNPKTRAAAWRKRNGKEDN